MNRAIAIAQRDGPKRGLDAIKGISNIDRLANYPFYPAALGELELRRGNGARARTHFQEALGRARNAMERRFFEQRLAACDLPSARSAAAQFWESSLEPSRAGDREEH